MRDRPALLGQRGQTALRAWRLSVDLAKFRDVKAQFDRAGLILFAYNLSFNDSYTDEEIEKGQADPNYSLKMQKAPVTVSRTKGPRYTPVSRRQDRPDAIAWFIKNHPEITDAQISKLLGTTKATIESVRDRTHWNSANIKPELRGVLDTFANSLRGDQTSMLTIVGHTDSVGTDSYNQRLSEKRAEAVRAYLISKGADASKVETLGFGKVFAEHMITSRYSAASGWSGLTVQPWGPLLLLPLALEIRLYLH